MLLKVCLSMGIETHMPLMSTWDWRLFTWLSLLWRNYSRGKTGLSVSSLWVLMGFMGQNHHCVLYLWLCLFLIMNYTSAGGCHRFQNNMHFTVYNKQKWRTSHTSVKMYNTVMYFLLWHRKKDTDYQDLDYREMLWKLSVLCNKRETFFKQVCLCMFM